MSKFSVAALAACLLSFAASGAAQSAPSMSSHFDGSRFFNPERGDPTMGDTWKWFWEMKTQRWPDWVENPPQPPPPERVEPGILRATYVNHATVLLQLDGLNILTDPIWSKRAGPVSWLGVKRVRAPGISFDRLPKIDVVLISHDHYDHLDRPTIHQLWRRDQPHFLVGLRVGARLKAMGVPAGAISELDWWQAYAPARTEARIFFVPARHGSGRSPFFQRWALWGGFVIDAPGGQVYFAGDTGFGAFVEEIAARFDRIRLAILPIGSYEKRWFMKTQHLNPEDVIRIHRILKARQSMGIHFATFAEHPEQSIDTHEKDLAAALANQGVDVSRFWLLGFGEGRNVRPLEGAR